jgi:hypothetical protein
MEVKGKIIATYNVANSEFLTEKCYPYGEPKIQKFSCSVSWTCGKCDVDNFDGLTELQEKGIEVIECRICKTNNILINR